MTDLYFCPLNYIVSVNVGRIKLVRKVNLPQTGFCETFKLYHTGTYFLHLSSSKKCSHSHNYQNYSVTSDSNNILTLVLINAMPTYGSISV
jgi:hypothetical protein